MRLNFSSGLSIKVGGSAVFLFLFFLIKLLTLSCRLPEGILDKIVLPVIVAFTSSVLIVPLSICPLNSVTTSFTSV